MRALASGLCAAATLGRCAHYEPRFEHNFVRCMLSLVVFLLFARVVRLRASDPGDAVRPHIGAAIVVHEGSTLVASSAHCACSPSAGGKAIDLPLATVTRALCPLIWPQKANLPLVAFYHTLRNPV